MFSEQFRKQLNDVVLWFKYNKLKFDIFLVYNFGAGDKGSIQFFDYRLVPQSSFRTDVEASRYFESYYCWTVGSYYILVDNRAYIDRGHDLPAPPQGSPVLDLDLSDTDHDKKS